MFDRLDSLTNHVRVLLPIPSNYVVIPSHYQLLDHDAMARHGGQNLVYMPTKDILRWLREDQIDALHQLVMAEVGPFNGPTYDPDQTTEALISVISFKHLDDAMRFKLTFS